MTEQASAPSEREKHIAARKARIRALTPRTPVARVEPTSDTFRQILRHPLTGMKFPAEGSAEWPLDSFTQRRIKEGCVQLEGGKNLAEFLQGPHGGTLPTEPGKDNALPGDQPVLENKLPDGGGSRRR